VCDHVRQHREARALEARTPPPAPTFSDIFARAKAGGPPTVSPAQLRDRLLADIATKLRALAR
jgi:hypothetical protein